MVSKITAALVMTRWTGRSRRWRGKNWGRMVLRWIRCGICWIGRSQRWWWRKLFIIRYGLKSSSFECGRIFGNCKGTFDSVKRLQQVRRYYGGRRLLLLLLLWLWLLIYLVARMITMMERRRQIVWFILLDIVGFLCCHNIMMMVKCVTVVDVVSFVTGIIMVGWWR